MGVVGLGCLVRVCYFRHVHAQCYVYSVLQLEPESNLKNKSYERSTEYIKAREWNAMRVDERSTGTIEIILKKIKTELNPLLD